MNNMKIAETGRFFERVIAAAVAEDKDIAKNVEMDTEKYFNAVIALTDEQFQTIREYTIEYVEYKGKQIFDTPFIDYKKIREKGTVVLRYNGPDLKFRINVSAIKTMMRDGDIKLYKDFRKCKKAWFKRNSNVSEGKSYRNKNYCINVKLPATEMEYYVRSGIYKKRCMELDYLKHRKNES